MKKNNKELIDITNSNLEKIFSNDYLMSQLNDDFKKNIIKQISLLNRLEKENKIIKKNQKTEHWLSLLKEKNSDINIELIDVSNIKNEEISDEINYITIYINNVFKIDLKNSLSTTTPNISTEKTSSNVKLNNNINNNYFNQNFDPMFFQEQMIQQMATQKLFMEVKNGSFYKYNSKPKIIPILKYVISAFALFYVIFVLLNIIFRILINGINIDTGDGVKPLTDKMWGITFSILALLLISYSLFSILKPSKNDNQKYFFEWKTFLLFGIIWTIISINDLIGTINLWTLNWRNIDNPQIKIISMDGYFATQIGSVVSLFLLLVMMVITSVFNPKVDTIRVEQKMKEIISDIKTNSGDKSIRA